VSDESRLRRYERRATTEEEEAEEAEDKVGEVAGLGRVKGDGSNEED